MSDQRGKPARTERHAPDPRPSELGEDFNREIRFAVVMYGGVSLAVYINGAAQELFHMVRATAPAGGDPLSGGFRFAENGPDLNGSARVYLELGQALGARFVVDILSGTSAGGINAIYLAKALVQNKSLRDLRNLWVDEGDLAKLLNDKQSVEGLPPGLLDSPPESVLNGQRFYRELLAALDAMDDSASLPLPDQKSAGNRPPYVDDLDLLITATDFDGALEQLELYNQQILEPQHRKIFRFNSRAGDLGPGTNPMLAFAARCTASFPIAFPPFRLLDIKPILDGFPHYRDGDKFKLENWKRFFEPCGDDYQQRYFVDGGYLDNKPFEGAIAAIGRERRPVLPVDRKLLYLEPHPDTYGVQRSRERAPDAVENLGAVIGLPRVETIRAQIEEIKRRNRVVQRAWVMTQGADDDLRISKRTVRQIGANVWALDDLGQMIAEYGIAYGGYHRLKVSRLTNWLAHCVDGKAEQGQAHTASDGARRLIAVWREWAYTLYYKDPTTWGRLRKRQPNASDAEEAARDAEYKKLEKLPDPRVQLKLPATQNRMLVDFDLFYRLRRIEFERLKLREATESPEKARAVLELGGKAAPAVADWRRARKPLVKLQEALQKFHQTLLESLEQAVPKLDRKSLEGLIERLNKLPLPDDGDPAKTARTPAGEQIAKETDEALQPLRELLRRKFIEVGEGYEKFFDPAQHKDDQLVADVRAALGAIHNDYAEMDLVRFSVLETMGTAELDTVDVIRVSALDTDLGGTRGVSKLAGIMVGHFGAFFDAKWREHDILWGRLDMAERMITTLAPRDTSKETVDDWLVRAFKGIINEELAPDVADQKKIDAAVEKYVIQWRPVQERGQVREDAKQEMYDTDWARVDEPQPPAAAKEKIAAYLAKRVVNQPLAPDRQMKLLNRTTLIIRDLVDGLAEHRRRDSVVVKSALRLLTVVSVVFELALPGLKSGIFRKAIGLAIFAGLLFAAVNVFLGRWTEVAISGGVAVVGALLFLGAREVPRRLARLAAREAAPPKVERQSRRWVTVTVVAALALAGSAPTFCPLVERASFPARTCSSPSAEPGPDMIDFELARAPERAAAVLAQWRARDVTARVRDAVKWDGAFIVSYVLVLAGLALLLGGLLRAAGLGFGWRIAGLAARAAAIAGLCDYVENLQLLRMLDGGAPDWVSGLTFGVASLKFGLVFAAIAAILALAGMLVVVLPAWRLYVLLWRRSKDTSPVQAPPEGAT